MKGTNNKSYSEILNLHSNLIIDLIKSTQII